MTLDLGHNQAFVSAILDGMNDAVLVVNENRQVVYANKALHDMFRLGIDPVGRELMEVVLDHRINAVIEQALEGGTPTEEEVALTRLPGAERKNVILKVDAAPLASDSGEMQARVILKDDTARAEMEQMRRDFVANASHELRTPLSIINGYVENLMDGAVEDPGMAQRFLSIMKKHGDRIARIVEDMLTISKFESAENPTKAGVFDLLSCVNDVIERLQPVIEDKQSSVTLVTDDWPKALLAGDRFYWDQIFFNLIENALKQNLRPNLKVIVKISETHSGHYQISITDDGVGIPQADLPFIFHRFYRVEKHHSQGIKGTGLGLSIVKRAIESHGGEVTASSTPGEQTTFTISVPKGNVSRGDVTD
jgi:signal transduction histidine kinase